MSHSFEYQTPSWNRSSESSTVTEFSFIKNGIISNIYYFRFNSFILIFKLIQFY
jgi:hypothetical protein